MLSTIGDTEQKGYIFYKSKYIEQHTFNKYFKVCSHAHLTFLYMKICGGANLGSSTKSHCQNHVTVVRGMGGEGEGGMKSTIVLNGFPGSLLSYFSCHPTVFRKQCTLSSKGGLPSCVSRHCKVSTAGQSILDSHLLEWRLSADNSKP